MFFPPAVFNCPLFSLDASPGRRRFGIDMDMHMKKHIKPYKSDATFPAALARIVLMVSKQMTGLQNSGSAEENRPVGCKATAGWPAPPQGHSARSEMHVLGNLRRSSQQDSEWFLSGIIPAFLAGLWMLLSVVFNKGGKKSLVPPLRPL